MSCPYSVFLHVYSSLSLCHKDIKGIKCHLLLVQFYNSLHPYWSSLAFFVGQDKTSPLKMNYLAVFFIATIVATTLVSSNAVHKEEERQSCDVNRLQVLPRRLPTVLPQLLVPAPALGQTFAVAVGAPSLVATLVPAYTAAVAHCETWLH